MNRLGAIILGCFLAFTAAHAAPVPPPQKDDLAQGLWWLYQLRYEDAIRLYDQHIAAHPEDPAGYFYKAAADWWHLVQNFEYRQPQLQKRFDATVNLTIDKAQKRLRLTARNSPEAAKAKALCYLYWGGAEGLRGRWFVTQKHWGKAYSSGHAGYELMTKALKLDPTLYDAYMGLGIYDYFSDTLSGFMGFLSSVFVRGDRKRGIRELEEAIEKSPNAAVESSIFLSQIYTFEENNPTGAMALISKLRQEYPDSPLMHLLEITALYQGKRWDAVSTEAQQYLSKSETETPWYTKEGVAPALYCLSAADLWGRGAKDEALKKLNRIISGAAASDPGRWISFAYLRRGQIEDLGHQRVQARADYAKVLTRPNVWGSHREAQNYLKTPYSENSTSASEH